MICRASGIEQPSSSREDTSPAPVPTVGLSLSTYAPKGLRSTEYNQATHYRAKSACLDPRRPLFLELENLAELDGEGILIGEALPAAALYPCEYDMDGDCVFINGDEGPL